MTRAPDLCLEVTGSRGSSLIIALPLLSKRTWTFLHLLLRGSTQRTLREGLSQDQSVVERAIATAGIPAVQRYSGEWCSWALVRGTSVTIRPVLYSDYLAFLMMYRADGA